MIPLLLALAVLLAGCAQVERPVKQAEEKKKALATAPRDFSSITAKAEPVGEFTRLGKLLEKQSVEIDKHYPEMKKYGGTIPWLGNLEKRVKALEGLEERIAALESEASLTNKINHVQNEIMNEMVGRVQRLEAERVRRMPDTPTHFYAPQSTPMYGRTP